MKAYRFVMALILLATLLLVAGGCEFGKTGATEETSQQQPVEASDLQHFSMLAGSRDETSLKALAESITKAQTIEKELQLILTEMQHNDEFIEAQESFETARQEILYIWNTVHNELRFDDPLLQKRKEAYEAILTEYREGLGIQLAGMKNADAVKTMEGIEQTKKAKQKLDTLAAATLHLTK
ncbi:hypothetical protein [Aneurinibacillus migulanus]|uniref:Lipoprotein n=1 Tax=Aneurinibacillus migulanus TaxID=47500 RepID=A0A0D1XHM8_ANEMI|nr:hypothetical protein [Aneurinibacillus migulanus]KIV51758.1 hypothetical protein TS65_24535 [Aneurinibacillus migulanus]KON97873.1 hypothetical protein AF333_23015 [Aneurinibacillus migulanus]MED0891107.1 hypothetical protein [Aneurinibacillus migulanus]MED1614205.1 hypothetical protein [Aneurinibacillus migulanus]SDH96667.1 hypothetical protein SAMN04487909_10170 [Aneurinibacillus migulanus]